mmetsp:Transcript_54370/g.156337  ORF Transcript_54370/g.156337 Transcript_54370/m.156337 type:complete len:210 (-) Transcript_54370:241-870(-)
MVPMWPWWTTCTACDFDMVMSRPRLRPSWSRFRKNCLAKTSVACSVSTTLSMWLERNKRTCMSRVRSNTHNARTSSRSQNLTVLCSPVRKSTTCPTCGPQSTTCCTSARSTEALPRRSSQDWRQDLELDAEGVDGAVCKGSNKSSVSGVVVVVLRTEQPPAPWPPGTASSSSPGSTQLSPGGARRLRGGGACAWKGLGPPGKPPAMTSG